MEEGIPGCKFQTWNKMKPPRTRTSEKIINSAYDFSPLLSSFKFLQ